MNFFKSVFADDDDNDNDENNPQPQTPPSDQPQSPPSPSSQPQPESPSPDPQTQTQIPTWGFMGGLIKTITNKSESVIETYRRDLQEFSSGLKMETQVLKEVASSSLEVGASKAQESLESMGQAIDSLGSVVTQIINNNNKQNQLDSDHSDLENTDSSSFGVGVSVNSPVGKYSRYDAQLRGIQCDVGTYVEECEDVGEFEKWKMGVKLEDRKDEMEGLLRENGSMEGIYKRVVPSVVDDEVFWLRYFYRVHKLEQAESVRAKLVERANVDEDLSWDVDDEVEEEEVKNEDVPKHEEVAKEVNEKEVVTNEEVKEEEKNVEEKAGSEVSKDSDISVVSSQPVSYREEEDLGWDEIEDLGSDDEGEKKGKGNEGGGGGSPSNREELRKRLSVTEDDEDLSWDIEDDDEPVKKS